MSNKEQENTMKMVVLYNAQNTCMIVSRSVHLSISTIKIGSTGQTIKMSMCMLLKKTHFVDWESSQDLWMKGSLHPNAIGLTSYVNFETYIQSSSIVKGYITSTHTKLGKKSWRVKAQLGGLFGLSQL